MEKNSKIRKARLQDIKEIEELLYQVHDIHAKIRPDLFRLGEKKYTFSELEEIINDENKPIYVYFDGRVLGYAFCIFQEQVGLSLQPIKTLYIDDLCVLNSERGKHIGKSLYEYVKNIAIDNNCYNITLNVWEGNDSAKSFYNKLGLRVQKTYLEDILSKENN